LRVASKPTAGKRSHAAAEGEPGPILGRRGSQHEDVRRRLVSVVLDFSALSRMEFRSNIKASPPP
jgi:hypothetical protein